MSAATRLPDAMTATEFLDWTPPHGGDRWELVDGRPRAMAPASPRHGSIQGETNRLLGNHLAAQTECRVVIEPGIRPRVDAAHNIRVPDLAITCAPWEDDERVLAAPLVLVEILSPSNKADTWTNVWSYTTIPSVAEILVLHTAEIRGELLRRQDDGLWPDDPLQLLAGDDAHLESIGFAGPLAGFYRTSGLTGR
ncbi:MAG: Uma2 family endonuclease [Acetobacteraceae bacterium]|jgi:Uma2 family endonuclease